MEELLTHLEVPDFPSLTLTKIELGNTYYPLSPLSRTLGYSSPNSLIQSIPPELKISVQELYNLYTLYLDQFYSYTPLSESQFKKYLSPCKPLWFTSIEGINYILTKNTFTIPRLKQSIATLLNLTPVSLPRKESLFYESLTSLLKDTGIEIHRHLYIAGYFVDIELQGPIHPTVIEYDENSHKYYSKDAEEQRELALKQLGYNIIRVNDSISPIESATKVFKSLLPQIN